jgi:ABC-type transporter Mla subunit MlaD
MSDEERQRQMDFILQQQAQLTATVGRLSETVDRTAHGIAALLTIAEIHEREIDSIGEAGRATDERLGALINTVERLISEGRGRA